MIDVAVFHPGEKKPNKNRPIMLYVGPIVKSRNLEAFLELPIHGLKRVIGEGRYQEILMKRYPYVEFISPLDDERLSKAYAQADVFVYPCPARRLDRCLVEALYCGIPLAGFPTDLMSKVVDSDEVGCVNTNLEIAILKAMEFGESSACVCRAMMLDPCIGMIVEGTIS